MAANKGWICLHRSIQDSWLWENKKDECFSNGQAWIDMILLANHEEKKIRLNGDIVTIERGQFHTSVVKLAERWNWSRNRVNRFLKLLEKDNMVETKGEAGCGTRITLINYGKFQDMRTSNEARNESIDGAILGAKSGQYTEQYSEHKQQYNNNINNDNNKAAPAPRPFTPYKGYGDKPKQTMFHNGEQNHYDFAELERQLLERDRPQGVEL